MTSIQALHRAINEVVAPKAPPRLSKEGAAVGLSFLDTSLRQNHVRRVTERIRCSELGAADRVVEVDISLNLLDRGQWEASRAFQNLRMRYRGQSIASPEADRTSWIPNSVAGAQVRPATDCSGDDLPPPYGRQAADLPIVPQEKGADPRRDSIVWVPITRVPRRAVSPIEVRDATGLRLPRLTQFESSRLLASGMYRLLRSILRSRRGGDDDSIIEEFLYSSYRSRWLVQAALLTLFTEQSSPFGRSSIPSSADAAPLEVNAAVGRHTPPRVEQELKLAHQVIDACAPTGFAELLGVAMSEYLLVVALNPDSDEHILSFGAPLTAKIPDGQLRGAKDRYVIRYEHTLPANLRAYHLLVEADDDVEIRELVAISDADSTVAKQVGEDLAKLSSTSDDLTESAGLLAYWRLEVEGCAERLRELVRRRTWEANAAEGELRASSFDSVIQFLAMDYARDGVDELRIQLELASRDVLAGNLDQSVSIENDPSSSTAHAYWRRIPSRTVHTGQFSLVGTMTLVDATRANDQLVALYAIVVGFIALIVLAATDWGSSGNDVDAAVAILLLVPGFLYYRLNLPRRHLILGRLQAAPRFTAYVCLLAMVLLSVLIIAHSDRFWAQMGRTVCALIPLIGGVLLWVRHRGAGGDARTASGVASLMEADIPKWYVRSVEKPDAASASPAPKHIQVMTRIDSWISRARRILLSSRQAPDLILRSGEVGVVLGQDSEDGSDEE
jgi:hypothetical protein